MFIDTADNWGFTMNSKSVKPFYGWMFVLPLTLMGCGSEAQPFQGEQEQIAEALQFAGGGNVPPAQQFPSNKLGWGEKCRDGQWAPIAIPALPNNVVLGHVIEAAGTKVVGSHASVDNDQGLILTIDPQNQKASIDTVPDGVRQYLSVSRSPSKGGQYIALADTWGEYQGAPTFALHAETSPGIWDSVLTGEGFPIAHTHCGSKDHLFIAKYDDVQGASVIIIREFTLQNSFLADHVVPITGLMTHNALRCINEVVYLPSRTVGGPGISVPYLWALDTANGGPLASISLGGANIFEIFDVAAGPASMPPDTLIISGRQDSQGSYVGTYAHGVSSGGWWSPVLVPQVAKISALWRDPSSDWLYAGADSGTGAVGWTSGWDSVQGVSWGTHATLSTWTNVWITDDNYLLASGLKIASQTLGGIEVCDLSPHMN